MILVDCASSLTIRSFRLSGRFCNGTDRKLTSGQRGHRRMLASRKHLRLQPGSKALKNVDRQNPSLRCKTYLMAGGDFQFHSL
jgi:hypothetical protein